MEMAYHELNQREYELTKHVSLLQVDPLALLSCARPGRCTVTLARGAVRHGRPGPLLPAHQDRWRVSIPCVTGPYASVNCTLTCSRAASARRRSLRDGVYAREDAEDDRVQRLLRQPAVDRHQLGAERQRAVRDQPARRALPAVRERRRHQRVAARAAGEPEQGRPRQFDYDTISDVILHIRYTAREGGALLRKAAISNLKTLIDDAKAAGSVRLFSVRHEFPTEWAKFQAQTPGANQRFALELKLRAEHYPFWSKGRLNSVTRVDILARSSKAAAPASLDVFDKADKTDARNEARYTHKDVTMGNC